MTQQERIEQAKALLMQWLQVKTDKDRSYLMDRTAEFLKKGGAK